MNMKKKDIQDTTAWALFLNAMPEVTDELREDKVVFSPDDIEVIVVASDIKLSFPKMVECWERHIEQEIGRQAQLLIGEKLSDLVETISEINEHTRRLAAKKLGVEFYDER